MGAITTWDTTGAKNSKNMFNGAEAFNQPIPYDTPKWKMTAVTDMEGMFEGAAKFNNAGVDSMKNWDTKKVTNMKNMFNGAAKFNKDLTSWKDKLSKVANNVNMWTGATAMEAANKPCTTPATNQPGVVWPACP